MAVTERKLDVPTLEQWLWDAACVIRGALDAPKYKDYILPLIFLKRLSDVFDDEVAHLAEEFGDRATTEKLVEGDRRLVRFYVPPVGRWESLLRKTTGVGQELTDAVRAIARENPRLQGVIDVVDFNATTAGQRIVDDQRLAALIQILSKHRLGLDDVEPDILGRAYEYLLRKFAEGQGQSAGEFYTPREVAVLIARLLDPQPGMTVYDPCCGSGGLLIKSHLRLLETHGVQTNGRLKLPPDVEPLRVFGQESIPATFAIARMNAVIHDIEAEIALGDTMNRPRFTDNAGRLRSFDLVVANPMWNQDFPQATYEGDSYSRFVDYGAPPPSTADWGWMQHMLHSLSDTGQMGVVLDTGAVARGSGSAGANRERDIRKAFVQGDLIEAVVLLPENLFYNTGSPGIVLILNRKKPASRSRKVILINASQEFVKEQPKNVIPAESVDAIAKAYHGGKAIEGLLRIMTVEELAEVDFDLSPSRHVVPPVRQREWTLAKACEDLAVVEKAHAAAAESRLKLTDLYVPEDEGRLTGSSKLGIVPGDWTLIPLAEVVAKDFAGDYGEAEPTEDHSPCLLIKATNFLDIAAGRLEELVIRYVSDRAIARKRIAPGDFVVETSGGGKHQPTGRVLYITASLAAVDPPLHPTNFTRLLRLDRERFEPRFVYHYWRLLYHLGRTQPYERQPTQIRNFKYRNFLDHELIPNLPLDEQRRMAEVLDALEDERYLLVQRADALGQLEHAALFDVLCGLYARLDKR